MTDAAEFGKRTEHRVVVFNNKLWLMGGKSSFSSGDDHNDVWCSDDGKKWNLVTNSAQWGIRSIGLGVGVFKNKLLLLGGAYAHAPAADPYYKDVWCSSDGKTWSRLTDNAPWAEHVFYSYVFSYNQIWILGGYISYFDPGNDVWFSPNGTDWSKSKAEWPARSNLESIAYDNKLWVIGGATATEDFSDVWYTETQTGIKEQKNAVVMPNHSLNIEKTSQNGLQIHFKVEETTPVRIGIFNSIGQEVVLLCNDIRRLGEHTIPWNGSNSKGRTVSGGIYFINYKTKNENVTHKVLFR